MENLITTNCFLVYRKKECFDDIYNAMLKHNLVTSPKDLVIDKYNYVFYTSIENIITEDPNIIFYIPIQALSKEELFNNQVKLHH